MLSLRPDALIPHNVPQATQTRQISGEERLDFTQRK